MVVGTYIIPLAFCLILLFDNTLPLGGLPFVLLEKVDVFSALAWER